MKAIRLHSRSLPTGMVYEEAPQPHPKEGEVLVRVYAAALTPGEHLWPETWETATGQERLRPIPGHEFSGVVVEIGLGVTQLAVGDAVYGYTDARRDGAEAEYCLAMPTELALKPSSLDHVQAAAVPLSALTAWQAFFDHAQLSAGQRVLIHGAAGGVGIFAVQIAHWIGAHVIGTASARHHDLLRALGTTEVIDYTTIRFEEVVHDIDLVLDTRGGTTLERSWNVLKTGGTLISLVQRPSQERAQQVGIHATFFIVKPDGAQLAQLSEFIERGVLRPVIEQVFPLSEAREAYQQVQGGHTQGKLVLRTMSQEDGLLST